MTPGDAATEAEQAPPPAAAPRRTRLLPVQLVYLVFALPWFALAIAATMGLANTDSWWSLPGILFTWSYPIAAITAVVVAHAVWARSPRLAHRWNLLAMPWVVVGVLLLLWIFSSEFSTAP